jgi:hypothetical protein
LFEKSVYLKIFNMSMAILLVSSLLLSFLFK